MNAEHKAERQASVVEDIHLPEDSHSESPGPAVYWMILTAGLLLLVMMPEEAAWVDTKRGWYTQPMVGSALGLIIMSVFALQRVLSRYRQWHPNRQMLEETVSAISSYRVALLSGLLFFIYIHSLELFGFVPSTLLFVSTLLWLSRLLDRFWFIATVGVTTVLVLIFRAGLGLWLPEVWLYEQLPAHWADFANQYL